MSDQKSGTPLVQVTQQNLDLRVLVAWEHVNCSAGPWALISKWSPWQCMQTRGLDKLTHSQHQPTPYHFEWLPILVVGYYSWRSLPEPAVVHPNIFFVTSQLSILHCSLAVGHRRVCLRCDNFSIHFHLLKYTLSSRNMASPFTTFHTSVFNHLCSALIRLPICSSLFF